MKIDAATYEVNIANLSQDITKEQFQRQFTPQPHKITLLRNTYMEEKYFAFFLWWNITDNNRKFE